MQVIPDSFQRYPWHAIGEEFEINSSPSRMMLSWIGANLHACSDLRDPWDTVKAQRI